MPILWLPRRCVFDGFLPEFEGFKGYVRPLSGRLSLAGWAGILLGLCRFGCVPTTGTSMLLAVSKVLFGHLSAATIRHPLGWNLARAFRFGRVPTTGTSMLLAVSKVLFEQHICMVLLGFTSARHFLTQTVVGHTFPLGLLCLTRILPEAFAEQTFVPQLGQAWVNERATTPFRTRGSKGTLGLCRAVF